MHGRKLGRRVIRLALLSPIACEAQCEEDANRDAVSLSRSRLSLPSRPKSRLCACLLTICPSEMGHSLTASPYTCSISRENRESARFTRCIYGPRFIRALFLIISVSRRILVIRARIDRLAAEYLNWPANVCDTLGQAVLEHKRR